jgi:hypothetical protein
MLPVIEATRWTEEGEDADAVVDVGSVEEGRDDCDLEREELPLPLPPPREVDRDDA